MEQKKYEIVKFVDNGFELEVNVSPLEDTVWLKAEEMALLFGVQRPAIVKHIANIIESKELDQSTCSILEQVQNEGALGSNSITNCYYCIKIIEYYWFLYLLDCI